MYIYISGCFEILYRLLVFLIWIIPLMMSSLNFDLEYQSCKKIIITYILINNNN